MPAGAISEEVVLRDLGGSGPPPVRDDSGGHGEHRPGVPRAPRRAYFTALGLGLAAITMFFMALTSAYVVRKGLGGDWNPIAVPRILWLSTAVLVVSSFAVERARRWLTLNDVPAFHRWWMLTTMLGFGFLGLQYAAWLALRAQGVFLATNPSASFFYVLTAAHGAHLLGGLIALSYVGLRNWTGIEARRTTAADVSSVYWHFMDGLWIFLFLLLQLGG